MSEQTPSRREKLQILFDVLDALWDTVSPIQNPNITDREVQAINDQIREVMLEKLRTSPRLQDMVREQIGAMAYVTDEQRFEYGSQLNSLIMRPPPVTRVFETDVIEGTPVNAEASNQ